MPEIVYTSIMEIKQLSKQHGCKVQCYLAKGKGGKPLNWIITSIRMIELLG